MRVTSGILPLKLRTGADNREFARAQALVETLSRNWYGELPFTLHVVVSAGEVTEAETLLASLSFHNINTIVHSEYEVFPEASAFHHTVGMYKQQIIKLIFPVFLKLGPFITFDADVLCLRPFNETSFVSNGRLISTWEPRPIHSWWYNSASALRVWQDLATPGLGVTPNVLHSELCNRLVQYLTSQGKEPIDYLVELTKLHPHMVTLPNEGIPLVWSEYSLYTLVSEWYNLLYQVHLSPSEVVETGQKIHSNRNVWGKDDTHRIKPDLQDEGYFMVVQSWAGVPIEVVKEKLGL